MCSRVSWQLFVILTLIEQCIAQTKFDFIRKTDVENTDLFPDGPLFVLSPAASQGDDNCNSDGERFDSVTNTCKPHRCPVIENGTLSAGEIVGIVIGILLFAAGLLVPIITLHYCWKSKHSSAVNEYEMKETKPELNPASVDVS